MIKTLVFDLGNVVVPFSIEKGIREFAGFSEFSESELRGKIAGFEESTEYHLGRFSSLEFFDRAKTALRLKLDFGEFKNAWNSIFLTEPIISNEFIERLAKQYRLIILSDTNEIHFEFIRRRFPIVKNFHGFVLSHEVGAQKPSPKMYEAAIKLAECLAEECFFTDDRKRNVEGAIEAGMHAAQFVSAQQLESHLISLGITKKEPQ